MSRRHAPSLKGRFTGCLLGLLLALPTFAVEPERAALLSLEGKWRGEWRGQNIDNGETRRTPVLLTVEVSEEGDWLIERITTPEAQFSQNIETQPPYRVIQQFVESDYEQDRLLTGFHYVSDDVWTLRFEFTASRQERPVRVQQFWRRLPDTLTRTEEVDYQDDKGQHWLTRQTLTVKRVEDDEAPASP
ncbi:hypothetical protein KUV89_01635 [Marinobacter hydrocarbonoclasticus]|nr:hypothetical protein [Marinobacter nauticus]